MKPCSRGARCGAGAAWGKRFDHPYHGLLRVRGHLVLEQDLLEIEREAHRAAELRYAEQRRRADARARERRDAIAAILGDLRARVEGLQPAACVADASPASCTTFERTRMAFLAPIDDQVQHRFDGIVRPPISRDRSVDRDLG
jgi:hypothetical protein